MREGCSSLEGTIAEWSLVNSNRGLKRNFLGGFASIFMKEGQSQF